MKTDNYPQGWVRRLDLVGMVLAPLSVSVPIFLWAILIAASAGPNGISSYVVAFVSFLVGLGILIIFGRYFRQALKSYVSQQVTRDDLLTFRIAYSIFILASLITYFMILDYLLYGLPKP